MGFGFTDTLPQIPIEGRVFEIQKILDFKPKLILPLYLKEQHMMKANIIRRHFPITVSEIRARLKLKEGGEDFLIATQFPNGEKKLFHCKRLLETSPD